MRDKMAGTIRQTVYGIRYIGNRDRHFDNLYGTGLTWIPGQVHNVEEKAAEAMVLHADVYELSEVVEGEAVARAFKESVELPIPPILPSLEGMDAPALRAYAQEHYGENLHHKMSAENMRLKIVNLIGERGAK
jgi:hypothetical protein